MKEFIDKLICRLEEAKGKDVCDDISCGVCHERYKTDSRDTCYQPIQMLAYDNAITIVNQLAEEFAPDINVGSNVSEITTGWISVSKRLPEEKYGEYYEPLYLTTSDGGVVWGFYRNGEKEWYIYNEEEETWDYVVDGYIIAWQQSPAPYTEGE